MDTIKTKLLITEAKEAALDIVNKAVNEKRELTEEENTQINNLKEQVEKYKKQIDENQNKNITNKTMKKINLSEIILAKKNGTALNEDVQNVLNETKKTLNEATNFNVEGVAIPFNLVESAGPEAIVSPTTTDSIDNVGALNATITDINGGSTIHTEYQSILAPIFNNNVLSAFDLMTGLRGNVEIPRYGGVSAYWKGELKKAGESTMKFDAIEVKPKRLTVFVDLSNQLLMQSAYNVEAYVREQMILAITRKLQQTILGDGAGDDVTPAGLFAGAEQLKELTFANLVNIEKEAKKNNVTGGLGYIINPDIEATARVTLKSNVAGAQYLMDNDRLIGQPTWVTNDAAGLLFGDLKQVLICVWGNGIDMKVDPLTLAQYDATRLVVNFYVDVVNRAPLTGEAEDATPVKNIFPFTLGESGLNPTPDPETYKVSIVKNDPSEPDVAKTDVQQAAEGDTVTITPLTGYNISTPTVMTNDTEQNVSVTEVTHGQEYTFEMPAENVSVIVTGTANQ